MRRNFFKAISQYSNNEQINDEIFSILLPKFVKDRVISSNFKINLTIRLFILRGPKEL